MKELMTIQEVAEYTGFKVSYLYQLTSKRKLAHYKPTGKVLFFKRSEVDNFFFSNRKKSQQEIEVESANFLLTAKNL